MSLFKKILTVIDYLEDIEVSTVKNEGENRIRSANKKELTTYVKRIKEDNKITRSGKIKTHFNKWILPPQPQAYIKCPRYDFL